MNAITIQTTELLAGSVVIYGGQHHNIYIWLDNKHGSGSIAGLLQAPAYAWRQGNNNLDSALQLPTINLRLRGAALDDFVVL